jgi:dephospho-CoA kinase
LVYASDAEIERRFLLRIEQDGNKLYNLNTLKDILSSQLPFQEKKKYARVVIDTSGTVEETQAKARIHLESLFRQLNINYKSV